MHKHDVINIWVMTRMLAKSTNIMSAWVGNAMHHKLDPCVQNKVDFVNSK